MNHTSRALLHAVAITPARQVALEILKRVSAGAEVEAGEILDRLLVKHALGRQDSALATELVYGVLRHQGYLDAWIETFSAPPLRRLPKPLLLALRVAFYQILFLDKIPDSAAVNTTVEWVKLETGTGPARLANALLREAIRHRERFKLPDPTIDRSGYLSIQYSHPRWIVQRWLSRWGTQRTENLLRADGSPPPLTVRINPRVVSREAFCSEVVALGGEAEPTRISPVGVIVRGISPRQLPTYAVGGCYIQDEAAQLISYLVAPEPGQRVLDACAAPGGKATHLSELMGKTGEVIAGDRSLQRLERLRENVARMGGRNLAVRPFDVTKPGTEAPFDRILVDAPCSALGTLRRNPEGKWRKEPSIVLQYAHQQRQILEGASSLLRAGGRMVYATCSTEPEENQAVVEDFLSDHPDFRLSPAGPFMPQAPELVDEKGYFNTFFNADRMDFFFAACLVRRPLRD